VAESKKKGFSSEQLKEALLRPKSDPTLTLSRSRGDFACSLRSNQISMTHQKFVVVVEFGSPVEAFLFMLLSQHKNRKIDDAIVMLLLLLVVMGK